MPAPITTFVDVNVNVAGASATKFAFGALLGVFAHTVNVDRINGPFFSVSEMVAAGFTSAAEPEVNAWGTTVFAQDDGVDSLEVGLKAAGDADYTAALDAIELAATDSQNWYITNIESRVDADIEDSSVWVEGRDDKIGIFQSADKTVVEFLAMQAAGRNRSAGFYHALDAEWLDGGISSSGGGLNLDAENGAGIWAYRSLENVTFDPLTGAEATAIYAADANIYGRNKGLNFTSKGTMASGRFIDVQTSIDWIRERIEEAIISLQVGTPTKIPYTNAGVNIIRGVVQGVMDAAVTNGHLSPDVPPRVIVPDVATVSQQEKIDRELTISATGVLAGAIQKLTVNVNLSF
jgi:hypothetical protein